MLCAVIPAAGRGSRLGLDCPKILAPIDGDTTIWSILHEKLRPRVDTICVVVAPASAGHWPPKAALPPKVVTAYQPEPRGMGHAVFCAWDIWKDYDDLLVIWGDQVNISEGTLDRSIRAHRCAPAPRLTLPLAETANPYVQYDFDSAGRLCRIRQTREGDRTDANGRSDVGLFLLSTAGLKAAWESHLATGQRGANTGELNFLPLLPFLSCERRWHVKTIPVADSDEARGINTPADLAYFRERLRPIPQ
ncbi:MAG TPA: NTP transferase domain-containing protein [Bryobacteraceae bacterium]|nr:NTP transferase domain-containing protein [Bryobacteraceae bacterium]